MSCNAGASITSNRLVAFLFAAEVQSGGSRPRQPHRECMRQNPAGDGGDSQKQFSRVAARPFPGADRLVRSPRTGQVIRPARVDSRGSQVAETCHRLLRVSDHKFLPAPHFIVKYANGLFIRWLLCIYY